jgi:nucleoside 2-deoxyribosyltransferase
MARNKVYLAGPDVFLADAVEHGRRKKQLCAAYGFDGLYPFDNETSPGAAEGPVDRIIYRANAAMIREADFGIANLTPFRGPVADVGTVFELGMLVGLGKPVFGYTNDPDDMLTRLRRALPVAFDPASATWRDADGMAIENTGNADNLMITSALIEHGQPIVRHRAQPDERFRDLTGFEQCLRLAARLMSDRRF